MKIKLILASIFLIGFLLRVININTLPPGLNWDEVSVGYNAYSIIKTGSDDWGELPIANFRAYGDYPLPLYMYFSIPSILIFGLNEFAIRLISVLTGSLLILVTFFLSRKIIQNDLLSLIPALLVAISPWTILTSRQVLQATPAILLVALGVYLFLEGLSKKWLLPVGTFFLGLSAYAYHNTRIIAPLILILLISIFYQKLKKMKKYFLASLVVSGIFFLPLVFVLTSSSGSARSVWVGILDEGAINHINELRANSKLPSFLPRFVYNKPIFFVSTTLEHYIGYFDPKFLSVEGGTQYQFSTPGFGVIYPITLPFFYIGIVLLFLKFKNNSLEKKFLLGWLLLAPIPAAVTRDSHQIVRALTLVPAIFIVTGFGFLESVKILKNKCAKLLPGIYIILLISLTVSTYFYLNNLWIKYPIDYSFAWQYGYKQAVNYVNKQGTSYDMIYFTKKYGEPHEFLLFYLKFDPNLFKNDPNLVRYERSNWFWVDGFDKYKFVNDWEVREIKCQKDKSCLLITSPGNYPSGSSLLETIDFLDGKKAFDIVDVSRVQ